MKTVGDVFRAYRHSLKDVYDVRETDSIALLVLGHVLNKNKTAIKADYELALPPNKQAQLQNLLNQLQKGIPVQYVLGFTEFYGLQFSVTPAVLIPRPETEELVAWILSFLKNRKTHIVRILDIGTGSGCIAITLKKHLPQAQVYGMDVSAQALSIARTNAEINQTTVEFFNDDILQPATSLTDFDIIVSNPPYVTPDDKKLMHRNVVDFEPHTALFVPQDDPLLFYRAISKFASNNLKPGGGLFFEINESYGKATMQIIDNKSFTNIELRKDINDKDRMVKAEKTDSLMTS